MVGVGVYGTSIALSALTYNIWLSLLCNSSYTEVEVVPGFV